MGIKVQVDEYEDVIHETGESFDEYEGVLTISNAAGDDLGVYAKGNWRYAVKVKDEDADA